ncbi:C40 family peptidase [Ottowia sp. SB7-C50]|uniref:C40 family peptidase n=1 Tax=Ottowia sp. SB7-C50 TaxID=3081231 RepID=UPI002953A909|nr:C40 family peptidase [Ottowia sp. SB7-C50]WOP17027.1 C40 family peptidase [Ottowia sp. SB7-C50]
MLLVNTPYRYGGNTPEGGFDCSGLVHYVFGQVAARGARLPRSTAQWAAATLPVDEARLQRGDLVFFNTSGAAFSHMGIYVGGGQFVHAPSTGGDGAQGRGEWAVFWAAVFGGGGRCLRGEGVGVEALSAGSSPRRATYFSLLRQRKVGKRKAAPLAVSLRCAAGSLRCSGAGRRCGTRFALRAALRHPQRVRARSAHAALRARPTPCASRHGQRGGKSAHGPSLRSALAFTPSSSGREPTPAKAGGEGKALQKP